MEHFDFATDASSLHFSLQLRCIFAASSLHLRCSLQTCPCRVRAEVRCHFGARRGGARAAREVRRAAAAKVCYHAAEICRSLAMDAYATRLIMGQMESRGSSRPSSVPVVPQQLHFPGRQHLMPAGPLRALRLTTAGGAYLVTPAYQGSHPILAVLDSNSTTFHAWPWWVE